MSVHDLMQTLQISYPNALDSDIMSYESLLVKEDVGEKHHILPKSLFLEFRKNPENLICLSPYNHLRAHKLLCEITGSSKMTFAYNQMLGRLSELSTPEEVLRVKLLAKELLRKIALGRKQSLETIQKRVEKIRGQKRTPEQIERSAQAHRGKHHTYSPEGMERKRESGRRLKGHKKPEGFGALLSSKTKGVLRPHTAGENSVFFGKEKDPEQIQKGLNTKKERGISYRGENNPMFGTHYRWMNNGDINKRVALEDVPIKLVGGWVLGRKSRG